MSFLFRTYVVCFAMVENRHERMKIRQAFEEMKPKMKCRGSGNFEAGGEIKISRV